jgi:hypothetical protein
MAGPNIFGGSATGLSASTFSNLGGAATDLFKAFGDEKSAGLQAEGMRLKAQGDLAEAQQYDLAGALARKNEQYTETSTAIQQAQQARQTTMQIGGQQSAIAGSGFAASGSGLDILADSARQGALAQQVLGQQGLITEEGYKEQAASYDVMASTARSTAAGEEDIANKTEEAGKTAMIGDLVGGLMKGAASVATLAFAPEVAIPGMAAASAMGDPTGLGGLY